jgi:hypothetical protein
VKAALAKAMNFCYRKGRRGSIFDKACSTFDEGTTNMVINRGYFFAEAELEGFGKQLVKSQDELFKGDCLLKMRSANAQQ